jgi:hypothetical protein
VDDHGYVTVVDLGPESQGFYGISIKIKRKIGHKLPFLEVMHLRGERPNYRKCVQIPLCYWRGLFEAKKGKIPKTINTYHKLKKRGDVKDV